MNVERVATYRPAWIDERGARVLGPDEDAVTLAVAVGREALGHRGAARVVVVVTDPDRVDATLPTVVVRGLDLSEETPVEVRIGGAPAALDAVVSAGPGTLVIGVEQGSPGAGAAFVGRAGASLSAAGRVSKPLPVEVHAVGSASARVYDDPRLLRERGWRVVTDRLATVDTAWIAIGLPAGAARRLGSAPAGDVPTTGASAPFFALAALEEPCRLVAIDAAEAVAVDVADPAALERTALARPGVTDRSVWNSGGEIPLSLAAFDRAVESKLGLIGAVCECGEVSYPPRRRCLGCGSLEPGRPLVLPRTGDVYSVVTVRTPVPAMPTPYSLAIVQLDGVPVRVLARVSDAVAGSVPIGARGHLVLRRVAVREGVPEYGYAFCPDEVAA